MSFFKVKRTTIVWVECIASTQSSKVVNDETVLKSVQTIRVTYSKCSGLSFKQRQLSVILKSLDTILKDLDVSEGVALVVCLSDGYILIYIEYVGFDEDSGQKHRVFNVRRLYRVLRRFTLNNLNLIILINEYFVNSAEVILVRKNSSVCLTRNTYQVTSKDSVIKV